MSPVFKEIISILEQECPYNDLKNQGKYDKYQYKTQISYVEILT